MGKNIKRREDTRLPLKKIYIFCEGEETEYNYFMTFKKEMNSGRQRLRQNPHIKKYLVERPVCTYECGAFKNIQAVRKSLPSNIDKNDLVICVIDCDSNKKEELEKAIKYSKRKENGKCDIEICFSNPSFEFWYLLHYEQFMRNLDQTTLESRLNKYYSDQFKREYDKTWEHHYDEFKDMQNKAIDNAYKLAKYHEDSGVELLSIDNNPSTMVHLYITKIRELVQRSP